VSETTESNKDGEREIWKETKRLKRRKMKERERERNDNKQPSYLSLPLSLSLELRSNKTNTQCDIVNVNVLVCHIARVETTKKTETKRGPSSPLSLARSLKNT
jgi:hypothetical protein